MDQDNLNFIEAEVRRCLTWMPDTSIASHQPSCTAAAGGVMQLAGTLLPIN